MLPDMSKEISSVGKLQVLRYGITHNEHFHLINLYHKNQIYLANVYSFHSLSSNTPSRGTVSYCTVLWKNLRVTLTKKLQYGTKHFSCQLHQCTNLQKQNLKIS